MSDRDSALNKAQSKNAYKQRLSIKFRLILSSGVVALTTVLAVGVGFLSYDRIEFAFHRVTNNSIPAMSNALHLVEQAASLSSLASTIAAATDQKAHAEAGLRVAYLRDNMSHVLNNLASSGLPSAQIEPLEELTGDLFGALKDLEHRVSKRLSLASQRQQAVEELRAAHSNLINWLIPKIDDANFDLVIQTEDTTNSLSQQVETLMVEGVSHLHAALVLKSEVNLMAGILVEAAVAPNLGVLEEAADRFEAARVAAAEQAALLSNHAGFEVLSVYIATLNALGDGPDGVFPQRRRLLKNSFGDEARSSVLDPTVWAKRIYGPREAVLMELEPIIDDANFGLIIFSESAVDDSSKTINKLIDESVAALRTYLSIASEGNWLVGLLRQASTEQDAAALGPLVEQIRAAVEHLFDYQSVIDIAAEQSSELDGLLQPLFTLATGQQGVVNLRAAEISFEEKQRASVELTHDLVAMLTQAAKELTDVAGADVVASNQSVEAAISRGRWLLVSLSFAVLLIAGAVIFRERIVRKKLEKSAREMQDHHDRLQEIVEDRTKTVSEQAEELRKALTAEKELSGLQRQFVSMVCHEFRTPLAIIDGSAQRLIRREDKITPDRRKDGLGKIRKSVIRLTDLMESVLSAARLEAGSIKFEPELCSLTDMIQEVSSNHQDVNPDYEIVTDLGLLPESFFIDVKLMRQVISNLISNAIKYSPGARRVWVDGGCTDEGDVRISVRDEGVGIPAAELEKLFARFFRASTSTGIAGTGIGLHMVKTLVDMHCGKIDVVSNEGEGTTFTVYLPQRADSEVLTRNDEVTAA